MGRLGDDFSQGLPIQKWFIQRWNLSFQALCINLQSFSRFQLSWLVFCANLLKVLKCNEAHIGCPGAPYFITTAVILLLAYRMQGTNIQGCLIVCVRGVMQIATDKQLMIWPALFTFDSMITGVHASDQNEGLQIWHIPSAANAWETIEYALKEAAVTILAGLLIFKIVNRLLRALPAAAQVVPEAAQGVPGVARAVPDAARALPEAAHALLEAAQALLEAARAVQGSARAVPDAARALVEAAPAFPEVAPALVIYPAVQGDDIDDVLENAPVATRRNSPLESWL